MADDATKVLTNKVFFQTQTLPFLWQKRDNLSNTLFNIYAEGTHKLCYDKNINIWIEKKFTNSFDVKYEFTEGNV